MAATRKVLMVVENLSVPTDPRVWVEATALRDYNYQVSIICPKGSIRDRESYTCMDDIHIYRYQLPEATNKYAYVLEYSVALLKTFWLSLKVLFRHGFDVIHIANPPDVFFLIGLFYRLFGKKFIFDQHDLAPELFQVKFKGHMKPLYKVLLFLERCSHQTAHAVIVTNLSHKRIISQRSRSASRKTFVVRNGPNLECLKPVTAEPELKGGRRHLLAYLGVMGVQDGVEYVLYALHDLVYKRGRQDISLVLMGDGETALALCTLAEELKISDYVKFTGWITNEDIKRYLTVTDVGLSQEPQNGLNEYCTMIKIMQYMAMGKPIVAFDLPESRFTAQNAALYATPNSVVDFANKIEVLLDNEGLRLKMGAIGRRRIEKELSWEHAKKHLLLVYELLFPTSSEPPVSSVISTLS